MFIERFYGAIASKIIVAMKMDTIVENSGKVRIEKNIEAEKHKSNV